MCHLSVIKTFTIQPASCNNKSTLNTKKAQLHITVFPYFKNKSSSQVPASLATKAACALLRLLYTDTIHSVKRHPEKSSNPMKPRKKTKATCLKTNPNAGLLTHHMNRLKNVYI